MKNFRMIIGPWLRLWIHSYIDYVREILVPNVFKNVSKALIQCLQQSKIDTFFIQLNLQDIRKSHNKLVKQKNR